MERQIVHERCEQERQQKERIALLKAQQRAEVIISL